jgi:hypothetical protein
MIKTITILILLWLVFSCGIKSEEKKNSGLHDFEITIDTLIINLKPYIKENVKVSLTHSLKFRDMYYCYFTDDKDAYNKYFFVISKNGKIEHNIDLPRSITNCFYLDLFVLHDTIFTKPYMSKQDFYLDLNSLSWIETSEPDDVIYEDKNYYVTCLDFGEWGNTTWYKDKISGKEFEIASSGDVVNYIDSAYYITSGLKILKIKNPFELKQCDSSYYYKTIKIAEFAEGTNSIIGTETVYEDTTYSEWDFKEPKLFIGTSFIANNKLYHLCVDNSKTYIAKLENGKFIPVQKIGNKFLIFDWSYSYRCKIQNDNSQLLKFNTKNQNLFGFIEIRNAKINIRYLKLIK